MRILKELRKHFAEVRILRDLVVSGEPRASRRVEEEEVILEEGVPSPVFCKRARKLLTGKELVKRSFLKSADEFENKGFVFSLLRKRVNGVWREEEPNAVTQRWLRDDGVAGNGQLLRFTRHCSMIVTNCQYINSIYCMVIRTERVSSNE